MKVADFMHEMQETSAILGRNYDIRVTFSGDEAYTDGKRINIPSLGLEKELTHEQIMIMRGYVDHEAGHIRHSDMPKIIDFYDRCHNNGLRDLKDIHNCIEDVWMEQRVVRDYPGAWKNLRQLNEDGKRMELKSFEDAGRLDVLKEVNIASVGAGIKAQNPQYLTEGSHAQKFLDATSENVQKWTKKWCEEALKCENSEDTIMLAKAVWEHIKQDPNLEQDPEDFDGEAGADMDPGPNSPGFKEGQEGKGKQKGFGQGELDGEGDGQEGEGNGNSVLKEIPDDYLPTQGHDVMHGEPHDGGGSIGTVSGHLSGGKYRPAGTQSDVVYKRGTNHPKHAHQRYVDIINDTDVVGYNKVKGEISGEINVMKTRLRRALLAKVQRDWDFGREAGRLDTKRLVSAYNRNPSVYKQRIDRDEHDTAVTILIDLSGSMSGRKAVVTRDCTVALAECLEGSLMPYKLVGFHNCGGIDGADDGDYNRVERLDTMVFKDYDTPLKRARGSVARINESTGGNNSDYDFIMNEIAVLKSRPEKRKVLMVLSDGHPAHAGMSYSGDGDIGLCRDAVKSSRRHGIECVGIGICDDAVKRIYSDNVVVHDVKDLSFTVFNKLTQILVG